MPERQADPEARKGVHGWRAFFLMFGCGTVAAVVFVSVIIGGLRLIGSTVSGFGESEPQGEIPEGKPRESLGVEELEICTLIEGRGLLGANKNFRIDNGGNYRDLVADSGERVISDDCTWQVASDTGKWDFNLTYRAVVSPSKGGTMEESAEKDFSALLEEIPDEFLEVQEEGDVEVTNGQARYFYGPLGKERFGYVLVAQAENASYEIRLHEPQDTSLTVGGPSTSSLFRKESRVTLDRLQAVFPKLLPDDNN